MIPTSETVQYFGDALDNRSSFVIAESVVTDPGRSQPSIASPA
jgi:hypothetical protein